HGQIAVVSRARLGDQAQRDFQLNHYMDFVDELGDRKKSMQDGRSDVIRQIAVKPYAPSRGNHSEVRFQHVTGNNCQIWNFLGELIEPGDQRRIEFDSVNWRARGGEKFRHFAVAGADFDPAIWFFGDCRTFVGVAVNADGARDLFTPA